MSFIIFRWFQMFVVAAAAAAAAAVLIFFLFIIGNELDCTLHTSK